MGKVNGRAKEAVCSVLSLEIINHKLLVCTLAAIKEIIIQGSAFFSIRIHNVD